MNIIEFRDFFRSELENNKESDYIFKILLKDYVILIL